MPRARHVLVLLSILFFTVAALPARSASADEVLEKYYFWWVDYPFNGSFDGTLTIESGSMKDGVVHTVEKTSTTTVPCKPVGVVALVGGKATFNGGYLRCELDLAGPLLTHHGIKVGPFDTYPRVLMEARLAASQSGLRPIFSHPDLSYQLEFVGADGVTMHEGLNTVSGLVSTSAAFPGLNSAHMRVYQYLYQCVPDSGLCTARHQAGMSVDSGPVAGDKVSIRTAPTTFLIGGDGATTFFGAIDSIHIDPGNTIQ